MTPLLFILVGCTPRTEVSWLEGAGFGWQKFNHRLAHLQLELEPDGLTASVIGGTSTTNLPYTPKPGCEACQEFPYFDVADVHANWATAKANVRSGSGRVELLADAAGVSGSTTVTLDGKAKGEVVAIIQGITISTDAPLSGGDACYEPVNGWIFTHLGLSLEVGKVDGDKVTVSASGVAEVGKTLESERGCIDEVVEQAQVSLAIDILVVSSRGELASQQLQHSLSYDYNDDRFNPPEQPAPDLSARTLDVGFDDALYGWTALDWRFHIDDPDGRGAYLRSLSFEIDPAAGSASGHATNYSPGTQLSGFDYTFEGSLSAVELKTPVSRGRVEGSIDVGLNDDGTPVVWSLPLK